MSAAAQSDVITPSQVCARGQAIYDEKLKPVLEPGHVGEFAIINVSTGEYEVGADHLQTALRARDRWPHAELYHVRVGRRAVYHFGGRAILDR